MAQILEKISIGDVRDCLDEMKFNSKIYKEEGVVVTTFDADEKFNHDVMILFRVEGKDNDWLKMIARADNQFISSDNGESLMEAYLIANRYNNYRRYAKAYVDRDDTNGLFFYMFEENLVADQPITFDFLKENIEIFCSSAWHFYSEFTTSKQ